MDGEKKIKYQQVYKCRLCGERYKIGRATSTENECRIQTKYRVEQMPFGVHTCYGGGIGASDFLGYEVEDGQE